MAKGVALLERPHPVVRVVGKAIQGLTRLPSPIAATILSRIEVLTSRMSKRIPYTIHGHTNRDTFIR